MKTKIILLTLAVVGIAAPALRAGLLDINLTGDIRLGRRAPPPPPAVIVVQEEPFRGPSPWERGRWYQRTQSYYYYPGYDVYYRQADNTWFYQDRGQWRSSRNLPDSVRVDFNRSVTVAMATDRPYAFHSQIVSRYPANYFDTRVRLRDDDRHDNGRGENNDKHGRDNKDDRGRDHR
ncbi:MAG: hypothetical protein JWQ62_543 [Lacunisphaera sp.]|nr:hypothetical protein [Lacunisphaera sp.]